MPELSRRAEFILLALLIILVGVLRLGWPGLTEFKADEARLTALALDMAEGTQFHIRGIGSSVGFPNFPASVWVYTLPLLLWKHVLSATLFTGLLNTAAVFGCYWLMRRYWGVEAALAAALMFAVSPWALHHSRKIWAQNLLPFFVTGWGISAVFTFVERRPKWMIPHLLCLGIAAQIHLAALSLIPATAVFMLIFRRRWQWRMVLAGGALVLLMAAPFAYYLFTDGQKYVRLGGNNEASVFDLLPAAGRGWGLQAFRHAWRLSSGQDIHSLTGPQAFEDFLATIPNMTAVYLLWGTAMLGGVGLMIQHLWRHRRQPDKQAALYLLLLIWLLSPLLVFTWPRLPAALHYLLPIYPVPYIAAGIFLSRWRQWWRGVAWVGLAGTAVAQVWVWVSLLLFVSQRATPSGFGTPLAMHLAAATSARELFRAEKGSEILIAGNGDNPAVDEFAAVYDVLLRDLPHRFVDVRDSAVFPAGKTILLLQPDAGLGAETYLEAGFQRETIPLRSGEGSLQLLVLPDTQPFADYLFDSPQILTNWASFAGYDAPTYHGDGSATWRIYWYTGEPSAVDYHIFNHLLNQNGERISQADTAAFGAYQWRQGDMVVSHFRLPWPADAVTMRSGMYRYPELEPVLIFDVAGNPYTDAVEISLP